MSYERVIQLIDSMHRKADALQNDTLVSMAEGVGNSMIADELRKYANELTLAVANDIIKPPTIGVKLVTKDRLGSTYVEPVSIDHEDDGTLTVVVEAWRE